MLFLLLLGCVVDSIQYCDEGKSQPFYWQTAYHNDTLLEINWPDNNSSIENRIAIVENFVAKYNPQFENDAEPSADTYIKILLARILSQNFDDLQLHKDVYLNTPDLHIVTYYIGRKLTDSLDGAMQYVRIICSITRSETTCTAGFSAVLDSSNIPPNPTQIALLSTLFTLLFMCVCMTCNAVCRASKNSSPKYQAVMNSNPIEPIKKPGSGSGSPTSKSVPIREVNNQFVPTFNTKVPSYITFKSHHFDKIDTI